MTVIDPLKRLLDHLSQNLGKRPHQEICRRCCRALSYQPVDRPPFVRLGPLPGSAPFHPFPHGAAFGDPQKMLYNELVRAFDTSIALWDQSADDLPLTVRANFGTVVIASIFSAPVEQLGDDPPWVRHDTEKSPTLDEILEIDVADLSQGWIPRVVETMQCYLDVLESWPAVRHHLRIVLPDLQGPFDNLELICGSDVFLQLLTRTDAIDQALARLSEVQIQLARHFAQWTTDGPAGYCHQHAVGLKGNILLRNDSCIMVSAGMYREQIAPHDEHVLKQLGGGGIHCCGNIGHLVDEFLALPSILSLDFGQSELNDVDSIYARASLRKVAVIRIAVSEDELASGQAAERFPTGAFLVVR
jgi:hypothetical protein